MSNTFEIVTGILAGHAIVATAYIVYFRYRMIKDEQRSDRN